MGEGDEGEGMGEREKVTKTSIQINQELWDKFKGSLPKTKTMSEGVEDLIRRDLMGEKFDRR